MGNKKNSVMTAKSSRYSIDTIRWQRINRLADIEIPTIRWIGNYYSTNESLPITAGEEHK